MNFIFCQIDNFKFYLHFGQTFHHFFPQAGLIVAPNTSKPVKTEMNLTTALTTRESAFLHQNGTVLDHRVHQAKDVSR